MNQDNILNNIKLAAFDLDGTVYIGNNQVEFASDVIDFIKYSGIKVVYFTNNSASSIDKIFNKIINLGIKLDIEDIYSSGMFAGIFLAENKINDIYLIGTDDIKYEISKYVNVVEAKFAKNLLVALDPKFNYEKITNAINIIKNGGKFIVCNVDKTFPFDRNKILPGCGSMVYSISYIIGKEPDFIIGKPNDYLLDKIARKFNINNHNEIIIIGDSFESDIGMARKFGSKSVLINIETPNYSSDNFYHFTNMNNFLCNIKKEAR